MRLYTSFGIILPRFFKASKLWPWLVRFHFWPCFFHAVARIIAYNRAQGAQGTVKKHGNAVNEYLYHYRGSYILVQRKLSNCISSADYDFFSFNVEILEKHSRLLQREYTQNCMNSWISFQRYSKRFEFFISRRKYWKNIDKLLKLRNTIFCSFDLSIQFKI